MIPSRAIDRVVRYYLLCEIVMSTTSGGNPLVSLSLNNTSTMSDIQALLTALDVLTRAPDKASLEKANSWLQDFQHSVNTLSPWPRRLRPLTRHHPPVLTV